MNQDFLKHLQDILKQHNLESSIDELATICNRYGIEKQEELEPDTISGIYHTLLANRQKESNDSVGAVSVASRMRQIFNKKIETEAQQIVQDYQNLPKDVLEAVTKTLLEEYVKKNPKIDEFLHEADYAKIAEENIQASQKMLKMVLAGVFIILLLVLGSGFLESFAKVLVSANTRKGEIENVQY